MFNIAFLRQLRSEEFERIVPLLPPRATVLEFGAGNGAQAQLLSERGFDVFAIDLPSSSYAPDRIFPVADYDGRHIPLEDGSVDVIFSSNVLEHVEDIPTIFGEFGRVLRPAGFGVHAMPTPSWRFWTFVAGFPTAVLALGHLAADLIRPAKGLDRRRALARNFKSVVGAILPIGHGTSFEGISELWTFSAPSWRRKFARHGFEVVAEQPIGLFYTGHMLLGPRLSFKTRTLLSRFLGNAVRIYIIKRRPAGG